MGLHYKVLLGVLGVLLSQGVAAQALTLGQHLEQNTVWQLTAGGGANGCPEYFRLMDSSRYDDPAENEDFRPGDISLGLHGFRFDEQRRERLDMGGRWTWSYRPSLTRGSATLEDNFAMVAGMISNRSSQSIRRDVVQLEFRANAYSLIMSGSTQRRLSYDRRTGSIELYNRDTGVAASTCRYEIVELPQPQVAVDDSGRGAAPEKPVSVKGAGQPSPEAQHE